MKDLVIPAQPSGVEANFAAFRHQVTFGLIAFRRMTLSDCLAD